MTIGQAVILSFIVLTFTGIGALISGQWKLAAVTLTLATTIYLLNT
jgi:hypothetical protein